LLWFSARSGRRGILLPTRAEITFAEFDASVKGWVNHVRYADTWGLRRHVFRDLAIRKTAAARERHGALRAPLRETEDQSFSDQ
jgi:hypothetical protein